MASSRNVVLVFLAHDGITQPKVWELWHSMCSYKDRLHLYIHCPNEHNPASALFKKVALPFGTTAWCQASLPFEHLRAIKFAMSNLKFNSATECLYCMVSGTDVPLRSADCLFECDYSTMIWMHQGNNWTLQPNPPSYDTIKHSQWMILASSEANIIINECLKDDYSSTDEFKNYVVEILCHTRGLQSCPDETLIGRILYNKLTKGVPITIKTDGFNNLVTWDPRGIKDTDRWLDGKYDLSPVNWYSPNVLIPINCPNWDLKPMVELDTVRVIKKEGFNIAHRYSHYCALLCIINLQIDHVSSKNTKPSGMFFRKVAKEMPYDSLEAFYRILFSNDNKQVIDELNIQNNRTADLPLAEKAKWKKVNPETINFGTLCKGHQNPYNVASIFDYNEDKLEELIRNNWTLLQIKQNGGTLKFKFNKNKYSLIYDGNKIYNVLENNKPMTTNEAKILLKNIKNIK